jgi:hypothetical protein
MNNAISAINDACGLQVEYGSLYGSVSRSSVMSA